MRTAISTRSSPISAALGIEVVADMPIPELATQSRLIIGFNTLAVLEGLLADCAVAVPVWGDASRDHSGQLAASGQAGRCAGLLLSALGRGIRRAALKSAVAGRLLPKGTQAQRGSRASAAIPWSRRI